MDTYNRTAMMNILQMLLNETIIVLHKFFSFPSLGEPLSETVMPVLVLQDRGKIEKIIFLHILFHNMYV